MTSQDLTVTARPQGSARLPDWAAEFALLVGYLDRTGLLAQLAERLRVPRQGGYSGLDIALFLLAFACWPKRRSIDKFSLDCMGFRSRLAAIGGRSAWPTASSVSRLLSVADRCDLDAFGAWVLGPGSGTETLVGHSLAQTRDTHGKSWCVLDFDPTVQALRQRSLPEGEHLPPARRRAARLCKPGYPGRKRGETQFSTNCLMSAGAGLWMQAGVEPGNSDIVRAINVAANTAAQTLALAGVAPAQSVMRIDGVAGFAGALEPLTRHGLHYLVRLREYQLFERDEITEHLHSATWQVVPDSRSGPQRQATEMGAWRLHPNERGDADVCPRIVATRFAASEKHGAGVVIDGWQYELFGTSLDASAWPAAETVELYYGRCGLENRFAQQIAELGLGHVHSFTPAGQRLVTLISLWAWNLRTVLGMRLAGPLGEQPPQSPREIVNLPPEPTRPDAVRVPPPVAPAPKVRQAEPTTSEEKSKSAMLARHPGWTWHDELRCPEGHGAQRHTRWIKGCAYAIFRPVYGLCSRCPSRSACSKSVHPQFQKEICMALAEPRRPRPPAPPPKPKAERSPRWLPPPEAQPGTLQAIAAMLLPSAFRDRWRRHAEPCEVDVRLPPLCVTPTPTDWLATAPSYRQRRRLTWHDNLARFALAGRAAVRIRAHPDAAARLANVVHVKAA